MAKSKSKKVVKNHTLLVLAACVVVAAVIVLAWMIGREVYLAESKTVRENKENIVINNIGASSDLVSALLAEKPGCVEHFGQKNISYIVREENGFALTQYGCSLDSKMFYKKVNGEWKSITPTNQFVNGQPLCSHLRKHNIPSSVQSHCHDDNSKAGDESAIKLNPIK